MYNSIEDNAVQPKPKGFFMTSVSNDFDLK